MLPRKDKIMRITEAFFDGEKSYPRRFRLDENFAFTIYFNIKHTEKERIVFAEEFLKYDELLDKTLLLMQELNLEESGEIAFMFEQLLVRGYFSATRIHNYADIGGGCTLDIMTGKGLCRHYSKMLNNLMSRAQIPSAKVCCAYGSNYLTNARSKDNHAVNLIFDEDGCYIYDATNNEFFKILSAKKAFPIYDDEIQDQITMKVALANAMSIKPCGTLFYSDSLEEANTFYDFAQNGFQPKRIDAEMIKRWRRSVYDALLYSMPVIEDFYDEIKPSLDFIVDGVARKREKK